VAELGFKILGGQSEKKKFRRVKTIKIIKFRGKINFFFGETPGLGGPRPPKARGSSAPDLDDVWCIINFELINPVWKKSMADVVCVLLRKENYNDIYAYNKTTVLIINGTRRRKGRNQHVIDNWMVKLMACMCHTSVI